MMLRALIINGLLLRSLLTLLWQHRLSTKGAALTLAIHAQTQRLNTQKKVIHLDKNYPSSLADNLKRLQNGEL